MNTNYSNMEQHFPFKNEILHRKISVVRTLETANEKAKISTLIPRFIKNADEVMKRLQNTEYHNCAKMLQAYILDERANISKICKNFTPTQYQQQKLSQLIDLFQENYDILKHFPDWQQDDFKEFNLIKNAAKVHFNENGLSKMQEEKQLTIILKESEKVTDALKTVDKLISQNETISKQRQRSLAYAIRERSQEFREQQANFQEIRKLEIAKCKSRINPLNFVERHQLAQGKLEISKAHLQKSIQSNETEIRRARDECNKSLIQYQSLLKKYDQEMTEVGRKQFQLKNQYDQMLEEHFEFQMRRFQPIERLHERTLAARQREDELKFLARVEEFSLNHAARVIQWAVRAFLRRIKPEVVRKERKSNAKKAGKMQKPKVLGKKNIKKAEPKH